MKHQKKEIMKRVNISVTRINFLSLEESPKLCLWLKQKIITISDIVLNV